MGTELAIILALVLANGFFSGAEIAVISLRRSRIQHLIEEGSVRARGVRRLREQPERFLATVQIGITVVGATAAAFGGASIADRLAPDLARIAWIGDRAEEVALAIVVLGVSYFSLVLGELVPKSLALKFGERYALTVAGPLLFLSSIARPLVWLLTGSSNLLLRPFGDRTTFTEARMSPEELQHILQEAGRAGTLDVRASEIASRAIEFGELTAYDVMVPRDRMIALPKDATREQLTRILLDNRHSRMPVYERNLDHIVGYIATDDILSDVLSGADPVVEKRLRPVPFVPEVEPAIAVLQRLQRARTRLAMVVDEHGGIAGLVTIDDVVEELVGEIFSEHEKPEELFRKDTNGAVLVKGYTPLRALEPVLGIEFPEGDYSTLAGLVLARAGRIPAVGETFTLDDGTSLEVVEATPRLVRSVRVCPRKREGEGEAERDGRSDGPGEA